MRLKKEFTAHVREQHLRHNKRSAELFTRRFCRKRKKNKATEFSGTLCVQLLRWSFSWFVRYSRIWHLCV